MSDKKLIMFDFDGTLVNTIDLAFYITKQHNPELTKEFFHSFNNGNFLENYFNAVKEGKINDVKDWDEYYLKGLLELNSHDVVQKLVLDLAPQYILTVVSSSTSSFIEKFLEKENIRQCFSEVLGSDVEYSKVKKINSLLRDHNIRSVDAVYITDTIGDIKEANECSVRSIGVTWGAHDRDTLEKAAPYAVVDDVFGLEEAIARFFK